MRGGVLAAALALLAARGASACEPRLLLAFEDDSRDRLTIINASVGPWRMTRLTLDLTPSAGRLVFDTAGGGAGVSAYADLRVDHGPQLAAPPLLADGARGVTLDFSPLGPGLETVLSFDLDDTLPDSFAATVSGAEIRGAEALALFTGPNGGEVEVGGAFDEEGRAMMEPEACS